MTAAERETSAAADAAAAFIASLRADDPDGDVYVVASIEAPSAFVGFANPDDLAHQAAADLDMAIAESEAAVAERETGVADDEGDDGGGFHFGPAFAVGSGCCGNPVGCTVTADTCLFLNHRWKKKYAYPPSVQEETDG